MRDGQPGQRQRRGHEIDDRFPAQCQLRIHPRNRLPQCELQIERAVHDDRQQDDRERDDPGVVRGKSGGPGGAAQTEVHPADERGSRRQVSGIPERGAHRHTPEEHVAREHREGRDDGGERPAAVENGVQHDAEDVRREAVSRERDAVAACDRGDEDEQHAGERQVLPRGNAAVDVGDKPSAETDQCGNGNRETHDERRCRREARRKPHVAQGRRRGAGCQARLSFTP